MSWGLHLAFEGFSTASDEIETIIGGCTSLPAGCEAGGAGAGFWLLGKCPGDSWGPGPMQSDNSGSAFPLYFQEHHGMEDH